MTYMDRCSFSAVSDSHPMDCSLVFFDLETTGLVFGTFLCAGFAYWDITCMVGVQLGQSNLIQSYVNKSARLLDKKIPSGIDQQPFYVHLFKNSGGVFDVLRTGRACDIIQLSAVSGGHSFNLYMVPRCRVQSGASAVTGFRVRKRRLYLHHRPMPTVTLPEALSSFLAFLRMLGHPLLIGHNVRRFDCLVLARALDEFQLRATFQQVTSGFLDTLPLARDLLRGRGQQSYRQENLVRTVLGVSYPAHNALEDVKALQQLYSAFRPTPEQAHRHTFTLASMGAPALKQPPVNTKALCRQPGQRPLWEQPGKAAEASPENTGGGTAARIPQT